MTQWLHEAPATPVVPILFSADSSEEGGPFQRSVTTVAKMLWSVAWGVGWEKKM